MWLVIYYHHEDRQAICQPDFAAAGPPGREL